MDSNSPGGSPDDHFAPPSTPSNTDYRHARNVNWRLQIAEYETETRARILQSAFSNMQYKDPRQIVVVGVCSAGKSTLVKRLNEKGYRVRACAQEHSYVGYLWQLSSPDLLVYLDASLHTIRGRGRARWQQSMLDEEHRRLSHAREHCHLYVHTDGISPEDVASRVVTFLSKHRPAASAD
jgi:pantothenate kinase